VIEGTKICSEGCSAPDDWGKHAACLDTDPEAFYCEADDIETTQSAIRVCFRCDIRGLCLEAGWKDRFGIWGSFTALEREKLRRAFPLPENPKHKRKIIRLIAHRL